MLFGKKKSIGSVSPEEIQQMMQKGMADKEIIKMMKKKGYSYESIESAMLEAVRKGVSSQEQRFEPPRIEQMKTPEEELFGEPKKSELIEEMGLSELEEETESPEAIIEDLVEGVIEEKWVKFEDRMKRIEDNMNALQSGVKQYDLKIENIKKEPITMQGPSDELLTRLDELEARIGGLEKAFRQFLPSLTKNIESLSHMIHEMKEKQGMAIESYQ
ncbi:MAG: hypothetical protein V1802_02425 [Candidatus Aenigmatarchaeota archaeon]